jgi:hypothetical protein
MLGWVFNCVSVRVEMVLLCYRLVVIQNNKKSATHQMPCKRYTLIDSICLIYYWEKRCSGWGGGGGGFKFFACCTSNRGKKFRSLKEAFLTDVFQGGK